MRSGWHAENDGSFTMGSQSRMLKPPPATPWAKLTEEWRSKISPDFHWKGQLSDVLEAAAPTSDRSGGKPQPWPSPEAFIVRWAKAIMRLSRSDIREVNSAIRADDAQWRDKRCANES
jgi:CRISPR/Cas system endoribonuclease Cas6 (RAMP superfamily)